MTRKRMRALKYSKQMVDDVSQLVYLHLRFHGYGDGKWTDSAVRRYVTDAGPLLRAAAQAGARRLHHPQQAPRRAAAGQLRRPRAPHRRAGGEGGPAAGAARPRRQRDHGASSTSRPGPQVGRGVEATSRSCGWTAGRSSTTRRSPNFMKWWNAQELARASESVMDYCLGDGDGVGDDLVGRADHRRRRRRRRSTRSAWTSTATAASTTRWPTSTATASPTTRCSTSTTTARRGVVHRRRVGHLGGERRRAVRAAAVVRPRRRRAAGGPLVDFDGDGQARRPAARRATATAWPTGLLTARTATSRGDGAGTARRHRRRRALGRQAGRRRRRRRRPTRRREL